MTLSSAQTVIAGQSTRLSSLVHSRDNNFNLIRVTAAMAVLVGHSFVLSSGLLETQPFGTTLGMTISSMAIDVFFITSGFLVTRSLLTRNNLVEYLYSRSLRIFPALFVMLSLTVFLLGASQTSLPLREYYGSPDIYAYFFTCLTLIGGVEFSLPGVYKKNPFKDVVNGSLWTLPQELKLYLILAGLWATSTAGPCATSKLRPHIFSLAVLGVTAIALVGRICGVNFAGNHIAIHLLLMFFYGSSFYVMRAQIWLSGRLFAACLVALIISALLNPTSFLAVYLVTIPYIVLYCAYIPSGIIREYNRIGDYSYGIYIYAFPVQQALAATIVGISVSVMIGLSGVITLILAVMSWHFIEKLALRQKGHHQSCQRTSHPPALSQSSR